MWADLATEVAAEFSSYADAQHERVRGILYACHQRRNARRIEQAREPWTRRNRQERVHARLVRDRALREDWHFPKCPLSFVCTCGEAYGTAAGLAAHQVSPRKIGLPCNRLKTY